MMKILFLWFYLIFLTFKIYASELKFPAAQYFPPNKTKLTTVSVSTVCGIWSDWFCECCGGCSTQRCIRTCQKTNANGCGTKTCDGLASKNETSPCTSPSVSCKFPLPVCCGGQQAYIDKIAKARWCKPKKKT